jgi:UDP-N-acetylmuramoyl-tripeptide--D-alanyl-D-alanine ligase
LTTVRAGDVVMVKGSLGSRMAPIVKAMQRTYPRRRTHEDDTLEHLPAQG